MTATETTAEATTPAEAGPAGPPRPLPLWLALIAAVAGGAGQLLAFPPYGLWWCAPLGVALIALACHRRRVLGGALVGFVAGMALFEPLLSWTSVVVGHWPWPIVLAAFEALYVALMGAAAAGTSRLTDAHRWAWPLLTGALWVGQEALRDRLPWGGFPWGRLAFSQPGGPLAHLASVAGAPGVTFAVALTGGLVATAAWYARAPRRAALVRAGALVAVAVLLVLAGLAVPAGAPAGRRVTIAVVQGNVPRLGLEFNAQRRAVLDNHVNATLTLARQVAAHQKPHPDLVVWPENSSDIDPLVNPDAYQRIDAAARAIGAPILVGAVLEGPGDHARNAGIVWTPTGGPQQPFYVKQHPVPFAEYIPLRSLARRVTDKVDLVRSDFVAGHRVGAMRLGPATVGDVICFEIGYDDLVRDTVTHGANLLTVQTNNADFDTAEASQQLAMVRLRALETDRPALMASTVGISAFVDADGTVHDATRFNTRAVIETTTRLGTGTTLAVRLGAWPEALLSAAAAATVLGAVGLRWRRHRRARGAASKGR